LTASAAPDASGVLFVMEALWKPHRPDSTHPERPPTAGIAHLSIQTRERDDAFADSTARRIRGV
jgi:hypothetical protein